MWSLAKKLFVIVVVVVLVVVLSVIEQQATAKITVSNKIIQAELPMTKPAGFVVSTDNKVISAIPSVPEIGTGIGQKVDEAASPVVFLMQEPSVELSVSEPTAMSIPAENISNEPFPVVPHQELDMSFVTFIKNGDGQSLPTVRTKENGVEEVRLIENGEGKQIPVLLAKGTDANQVAFVENADGQLIPVVRIQEIDEEQVRLVRDATGQLVPMIFAQENNMVPPISQPIITTVSEGMANNGQVPVVFAQEISTGKSADVVSTGASINEGSGDDASANGCNSGTPSIFLGVAIIIFARVTCKNRGK